MRDYLDRGWWRPETVLDLFAAHVAARADRPALTDAPNLAELCGVPPRSLTWRELDTVIDELAARLHSNGVRAGDVVAVLLPNSVALTATYFALWRLGAIAAPMPASYRRHELRRIVARCDAVAVVTVTSLGGRAPHLEALSVMDETSSLERVFTFGEIDGTNAVSLDHTHPSDTAVQEVRGYIAELPRTVNDCITICWTSGTEAEPKGVPRCHGDWLAIGQAAQDGLLAAADSVIVGPFPMVNMAGFATSLLPWLLGGSHLVQHHPLDLGVYLSQIESHRATHTSMPPTILALLLRDAELRARFDLSTLRRVGSGGAPLPPDVVRDWQTELGIEVLNFFGSNEGVCLLGVPADTPDPILRAGHLPNYGSTRKKWSTSIAERTAVRLIGLDGETEVTTPGDRGELRLQGPTVFAGYLPGTAASSPFDDHGFLRTGDVFELCGEHGEYLRFVDRSKEIIIRGGMNIAPAEIESLLGAHPAVVDIAVVGYPDPVLGEKCCAVAVPAPGSDLTLDILVSFLREQDVASFKLPERLVTVETLPRNPIGKLQRRKLRDLVTGEQRP
ncbi:class I adenylate-forming enzyme family protein [Nocardia otitidiscaviarum]|uniref:class I adenylate-forming enzyme family protein n=1 Tax=Nocardia otitidiscaviarum TaxID=1823 RepID=UPI002B4AE2C5|nr:class I adenylate-forming enzyme family protein [Nocardia otitidiscaviarum]